MEIVTRPHRTNLIRWAADKPEILVLSADLTSSCEADGFRDAYPDRFFSMGMAEQNLMGFAGGLAREGFIPLIHTFAVFVSRRPFDQVAMSIAYPNLPVRLLGFLPGLTTPGGVTHQAIDDLGLMRLLPNMTVIECGDATEVESVLDLIHPIPGPVYVRMLRGEIPRLFDPAQPMRLGLPRTLSEGEDFALVSSGVCTEEALRATTALRARGVSVHHLHYSTIKPIDERIILDLADSVRHGLIVMENHSVIGGLGSAVAEVMACGGSGRRLIRLGIRDTYAHGASRPYLMREYEIDARALVDGVERRLGQRLGITKDDLDQVDLPSPSRGSELEDL
jgi:transketolase